MFAEYSAGMQFFFFLSFARFFNTHSTMDNAVRIDGKIAIVLWKTFDEILIVSGVKQFKNV